MPDYRIKSVHAVQVQSRRHNMAVSARVETMDGAVGKALCYAGVSVGTHEVHFQYDGGNRWGGLGCMSAVRNVNTIIADTILGMDVRNQFEIDQAQQSFVVGGKEITAELLAEALHSLPDEKRETVLLYYFFDMSEREIAKYCNIPRTTVQTRRKSSMKLLKRYLEERAYDYED